MIGLSIADIEDYNQVLNLITYLKPGHYMTWELFERRPTNPRVCRKLYADTLAGAIENFSLYGDTSSEGYLKS